MKKLLSILALCSFTFFSCKKKTEDTPAPAPLVPYSHPEFLKQTGFDATVTNYTEGPAISERGTIFEPQADGNITAFVVNLPSSVINLKITLWNATTKVPLKSSTVTYPTPSNLLGENATYAISAVAVQKNQKYCVSFTTQPIFSYFKRKRTNGADATYPVNFTNMKILSHNEYTYPTGTSNILHFPDNTTLSSYFGDVHFVFQ
jgi:hypothetical protein